MYIACHLHTHTLPHTLYTSKRLVAPWGWSRFKAETCRSEYNKYKTVQQLATQTSLNCCINIKELQFPRLLPCWYNQSTSKPSPFCWRKQVLVSRPVSVTQSFKLPFTVSLVSYYFSQATCASPSVATSALCERNSQSPMLRDILLQ